MNDEALSLETLFRGEIEAATMTPKALERVNDLLQRVRDQDDSLKILEERNKLLNQASRATEKQLEEMSATLTKTREQLEIARQTIKDRENDHIAFRVEAARAGAYKHAIETVFKPFHVREEVSRFSNTPMQDNSGYVSTHSGSETTTTVRNED